MDSLYGPMVGNSLFMSRTLHGNERTLIKIDLDFGILGNITQLSAHSTWRSNLGDVDGARLDETWVYRNCTHPEGYELRVVKRRTEAHISYPSKAKDHCSVC